MSPCETVNLVGVITCAIADCVQSQDQLELIASIFVQLGDSLETYATVCNLCCGDDQNDPPIQ